MNIRGLVIGALVLAGCSETASGPAPIPAPSTGWTYGVYVDEMDGSSHPWACVESENVVQASFPHKSARPTLCIQKHNDQSDGVYISMNKSGQVQCHDCFVRVRSDDKEPHEAPADQSSNGETDMLYFGLGDVMAVKIAASKQLAVEVPLFSAPDPVIRFSVADLEWPRPSAQ